MERVRRIRKAHCEWDRVAEAWDREAADQGMWYQRTVIDPVTLGIVGKVKGKRILEMGCGNGYFSRRLAREGAKAVGVDSSAAMIRMAWQREKAMPTGARFLCRDAARLPVFKRGAFDLVVANMCLMDVKDTRGAIREASRLLKRQGRFVFSITHPLTCDYVQYWSIQKLGKRRYFGRFVYRYLRPMAMRAGLPVPGHPDFTKWDYHRPISGYLGYLRDAGLLVTDFVEIPAVRKVTKASRADGDVTYRRSKYRTLSEKRMKEMAGREIPLFLVVGARKS